MIDSKLQSELRARFNPEGSNLRRMQLRMLEMLKYLDRICRENDIKYWLSSGTCLGAVRHGGFIPWDDDCDIEMLDRDYEKLIKILTGIKDSQYIIQYHKNEKNYFLPFAKLRDKNSSVAEPGAPGYEYSGLWLDIFPVGRKTVGLQRISTKIHNVLLNPNFKYHIKNRLFQRFAKSLYFNLLMPGFKFVNLFIGGKEYHHAFGTSYEKPRFGEDIGDVIYVKFEDTELPVPKNFDHYLKTIYGDYAKIPNIDEIGIHNLYEVKIFE